MNLWAALPSGKQYAIPAEFDRVRYEVLQNPKEHRAVRVEGQRRCANSKIYVLRDRDIFKGYLDALEDVLKLEKLSFRFA